MNIAHIVTNEELSAGPQFWARHRQIRPLAQEFPYVTGAIVITKKKKGKLEDISTMAAMEKYRKKRVPAPRGCSSHLCFVGFVSTIMT